MGVTTTITELVSLEWEDDGQPGDELYIIGPDGKRLPIPTTDGPAEPDGCITVTIPER